MAEAMVSVLLLIGNDLKMERESRVKKSLLNARVNLICYMASLVVAFFTRKVFLDQLGTEFIGLTGTLQSLLGFLNLAELGVGSAIGYVLYQPIFDDNKNKINEIISVFGYLYRWIGFVILGAGVVLSAFLPLIFPNTSFSWGIIYFGFYAYLAGSMLGYFVNYRMTLLGADQRNYVVTGYFQATSSGKAIVQMLLALYICNFYLYLTIEILFGVINSIILNWKINKTYPWLSSDIHLGKKLFKKYPEIGRYVKQLFIHKIGSFVQFQISPFLIYSYVSLPVVALYGNYTTITQKIQSFISGVLDSTGAGVGNLISERNQIKIYMTYKELFAIRFLVAGILTGCVYHLCNPFISVWLGKEYSLSMLIVLLISVQLFLSICRGVTDQFLFGYGLFYDIWAPAVESAIFIITATICGSMWGLSGVLCGPLVSLLLIVYIWKPYFLFTRGFHKPFSYFLWLFISHSIAILGAYWCARLITLFYNDTILSASWSNWVIGALLFTVIMSAFALIFLYLISSGLRSFIYRIIRRSHGTTSH